MVMKFSPAHPAAATHRTENRATDRNETPVKEKQQTSTAPTDYRHGHRERLKQRFSRGGPSSIADHELLEMILFRVHTRRDVKPIAHQLLAKFGDLSAVMSAPDEQLLSVKGVGAKTIHEFRIIEAAALRFGQQKVMHREMIKSWDELIRYCRTKMAEKRKEEFHVLFLDKQNQIIADEVMGSGTVDHTPVYPREVIKRALHHDATALIIVHNHPSGDPSPSKADIEMTEKLRQLAHSFGISLHDHLVIGRKAEFSFKNERLI